MGEGRRKIKRNRVAEGTPQLSHPPTTWSSVSDTPFLPKHYHGFPRGKFTRGSKLLDIKYSGLFSKVMDGMLLTCPPRGADLLWPALLGPTVASTLKTSGFLASPGFSHSLLRGKPLHLDSLRRLETLLGYQLHFPC